MTQICIFRLVYLTAYKSLHLDVLISISNLTRPKQGYQYLPNSVPPSDFPTAMNGTPSLQLLSPKTFGVFLNPSFCPHSACE